MKVTHYKFCLWNYYKLVANKNKYRQNKLFVDDWDELFKSLKTPVFFILRYFIKISV